MADEPSPEDIAHVQKENCIFCKIIKGEIPSRKVFEDDILIAILDINPAGKGHTIVMPKEHYPILPVIPPDIFKHTFKTTKYLMRAVREGMVATGTTVFIANGAVAGQQSPHFLFHIIPRDEGDGLTNFSLPEGKGGDGGKLTPALQANVAGVMRQYLQREGLLKAEVKVARTEEEVKAATDEEQPPLPAAPSGEKKRTLAETIMENEVLRELIIKEPEKVKALAKENADFRDLFHGINIDKLSEKLKEIDRGRAKKPEKRPEVKPDLDQISRILR